MKHALGSLVFLLAACTGEAPQAPESANVAPELPGVTLPVADRAGNRMEALSQAGAQWCAADGAWCLEGARVTHGGASATLPGDGAPWPVIIRLGADAALVGLTTVNEQPYSGGGGSATHLTLYEVTGATAREVARLPLRASSNVRACFDADDEAQRAGACQDLYEFVTRISLDEGVDAGAPRIILETAAGTYPGRVTRTEDSANAAPLTQADLIWARDETCSYRRVFVRGGDGAYAPDAPLPACTDYLEP